jgi:hypothetical protein
MNNRISGDFGMDALEAFRAAYAQREVKPEDLEVDNYTGLPTGEITNISPWIQHTGLWKANPGTDRAFVPNQILELEEDFEDEGELSEEEFDQLVDEVLSDLEEEERFADDIYNGGDDEEDEEDEEEMEDSELESLIDRLLSEREEEVEEVEEEVEEEVASEEELESLIQEILEEIEAEEEAEEREAAKNREVSNEELEDMINDLEPGEGEESEDGEEENPPPDSEDEEVVEESEELNDEEIDRLVDEILGEEEE